MAREKRELVGELRGVEVFTTKLRAYSIMANHAHPRYLLLWRYLKSKFCPFECVLTGVM